MPADGASETVTFQGHRTNRHGQRVTLTVTDDVVIWPSGDQPQASPLAAKFLYAIMWDPDLTYPDESPIADGDFILWDRYEQQGPLALSAIMRRSVPGGIPIIKAYFMPVAGGS